MNRSPLLDIFKHFTKQDCKDLSDFVNSPFHNKNREVVLLFDYLNKHVETPINLKKETVFANIFPNMNAYNDKKMRYTMSFLMKCIQQYLVYNDVEKNDLEVGLRLNRALRLRGADKAYAKALSENYQRLEQQVLRHADFHLYSFHLQLEELQYRHQKKRSAELNLQAISDSLTDYYATQLLRQACVMHSHAAVSKKSYNHLFLDTILEKIRSGAYSCPPSVSAYFFAYKMLLGDSQFDDFQRLKQMITSENSIFPQNEIRDFYLLDLLQVDYQIVTHRLF